MDYMTTRGKLTDIDLAYIAGLFDGEGHVFIDKRKVKGKMKTPTYILHVGITNTYKDVIDWIYENFPTTISYRVRHKDHPTWKACYFWTTSARRALEFLKIIYPYLKIKKEQARLAIEFQAEFQKRTFDMKGRIEKTPDDVIQRREWYKAEISKINKGAPAETNRGNT